MAELYTVTVPPAELPITLEEAKAFMRVTSTAEDALISVLISAATESIEQYTGQYFIERTVQGDFDNIMTSGYEIYPWVKLRRAPLQTITSVQVSISDSFVDEAFQIKKHNHGFSRILFPDFNNDLDDTPFPLQIVFTAGYGDASDVPENIKTAIKMYINFLYRNRGDCIDGACGVLSDSAGLGPVVKALLAPYKIIEVYA